MEKIKTKNKQRFIVPRIPDELVYEIIDGKQVYYKGYKEVLKQEKQIGEIMGSSELQAQVIKIIVKFLFEKTDGKIYDILFSELGLHLNKKNNLSADIVIREKAKMKGLKIENNYSIIPPKIVFEIDTKADLGNFDNIMEYYQVKTNKLFEFGVEKVIWILTKNKQNIEAVPGDNWLVKEWDKEIEVFKNLSFSIDQLLKDDGIYDLVY